MLLTWSSFSFADDTLSNILGILGGQNSTQTSQNCPSCGYTNQSNAAFCAKCGNRMPSQTACPYCNTVNQPDAFFCSNCGRKMNQNQNAVRCSNCNRVFDVDINTVLRICPNCETRNDPGTNYCSKCGQTLTCYYLFQCPNCQNEFVSIFPQESADSYCPNCRHHYSNIYTQCPYCNHGKDRIRHNRDRDQDRDRDRDNPRHRQRPEVSASSEPVLVDSFIKADAGKEGKRYSIGAHTGSRAFTKVIVDVQGPKAATLGINTLSVRVGGRWNATPITTRLQAGRNEFGISVPQGATELNITFVHGQKSEVKVSME
jgi:hypothetical protein